MESIQRLKTERIIKSWVVFFIVSLVVSGLTAFPLETELYLLHKLSLTYLENGNLLGAWIAKVYESIHYVNTNYPFMAYGTDWLAFAHLVIAVFFIGVYKDPVKNQWIITAGMIACIAVIPLAFIAGAVRDIPVFWRLIDCSFGIVGIIPLIIVNDLTEKLKNGSNYYMKSFV